MSLRWQSHYFDETYRFDRNTVRKNPNIVARRYLEYERKLTHDLYGSYTFDNNARLYVGVNNLSDQTPDAGETFYPVSAVGRYVFAGLQLSL